MTLFTVHLPEEAPSGEARLLRAELVKDGFHWWAFLVPVLWLLWFRVWWGLLGYLAYAVALMLVARFGLLPPAAIVGVDLLVRLFLGLVAGELRGWQLGRRGFQAVDIVSGRDRDEAERRFFDRASPKAPVPASSGSSGLAAAPRPAGGVPGLRPQPVLGLFPESGGTR